MRGMTKTPPPDEEMRVPDPSKVPLEDLQEAGISALVMHHVGGIRIKTRRYRHSLIDHETGPPVPIAAPGPVTGGSVLAEASDQPPEVEPPEDTTNILEFKGKLYRTGKKGTEVNTNWSLNDVQEYTLNAMI